MTLKIEQVSQHPTIEFAACELGRYQARMTGSQANNVTCRIQVGLFADLLPDRADATHPFDDAILIEIRNGSGIVAGINPRSCLIAVYRLLREAGCRFLRPGPDGELIPAATWEQLDVSVDERPSYRHRGLCIEGAVSREIFLAIIDWLPKNGLNAYFIQFREGFTFFDRWYSHKGNPFVPSDAKTVDEVRAMVAEGAAAIRLRGLVYHAVGHGWTCEPLGIPGTAWEAVSTVPEGASRYFAEIGGKRELFHGVPLNTNLCYGNPEVRDLIVQAIVDYAAEHAEVDIIHFWLADGTNNQCECPLCRDIRPADFYVAMLNALDDALTKRQLPQRIVFLVYVDLLWEPLQESIRNPDRFILMFAPITRTYSQAFVPGSENATRKPYVRNRLTFPVSAAENLAYLKPWQKLSGRKGDGFDFDYHLMWDHYRDPGHELLAPVLHQDLQNLGELGLNGLISCQVQRLFFPTPLLMQIVARTLWQKDLSLDAIATDVYQASFGEAGGQVRASLKQLSALFNAPWLRGEEPLVQAAQADKLRQVPALVTRLASLIQDNLCTPDPCQRKSWQLLALFGDYALQLAEFCLAVASDQRDEAGPRLTRLLNWVYAHEDSLAYVFDSVILSSVLQRFVNRLEEGK